MQLPMKMVNLLRRLCEYCVRSSRLVLRANGTIAMRPFSGMFRRHPTIYSGKSTGRNLMKYWPQEKESAPGPDGIPYSIHRCAGGWCSRFLCNAYRCVVEGGDVPASRTAFIPKSSDVDGNGRIVRSPAALRPLTLCNCDYKIVTTAIRFGLHKYSVRCYTTITEVRLSK